MTYNTGTATSHLTFLNDLIAVVTSNHMATVAVVLGGTGHAIGDIIDITVGAGVSTSLAKIEVVTLSGSAIATARIFRGGAYTTNPTPLLSNAQSATTGSGTGATFDLTFTATGWSVNTRNEVASSVAATPADGGTGYTASDVLTAVGGVLTTTGAAATFTVTTVAGGVVTVMNTTPTTVGDYEVFPTNPVQTTGGTGTGCTLTLTPANATGEINVVLKGDAGGSAIDPPVGIKTYSTGVTDETGANTVANWAMFGFPSWDSTQALHGQALISPGFNVAADGTLTTSTTGDGAFVPMRNDATSFDWKIRSTGRSVVFVVKMVGASSTNYAHGAFGLLNQFGITSELPFPAFVAGTSDRKRVWFDDSANSSLFGGLSFVISRANGPMFVWSPESSWIEAKNAQLSANQSGAITFNQGAQNPKTNVWPLGNSSASTPSSVAIWSEATSLGFDISDLILTTGATQIFRTPDTGGNLFPLFPVTIIQAQSTGPLYRVFGEIDGVFWFSKNDAGVTSEDRFAQSSLAYSIYQNGTESNPYAFLALKED